MLTNTRYRNRLTRMGLFKGKRQEKVSWIWDGCIHARENCLLDDLRVFLRKFSVWQFLSCEHLALSKRVWHAVATCDIMHRQKLNALVSQCHGRCIYINCLSIEPFHCNRCERSKLPSSGHSYPYWNQPLCARTCIRRHRSFPKTDIHQAREMLWRNEGHFNECRASRRLDQQFYRVCPPRHRHEA